MKLTKVKIRNYRLLRDVKLDVDSEITLIVGRNNTAKTSCSQCIGSILRGGTFSFYDYPLSEQNNLFEKIEDYMKHEITFDELRNDIKSISVELYIDYSLENPDDNLGALSPFIIDVDESITTALIIAEYRIKPDEKGMFDLFKDSYCKENIYAPDNNSRDSIKDNFNKIFELIIYAANPQNPSKKQIKKLKELQDLFPFRIIPAERTLGEDDSQNNSLSSLISSFFNTSDNNIDSELAEKIKELRSFINEANTSVQRESEKLLSEIVNKTVGFGYPNSEELQLAVTTKLSVDEQIINKTELAYTLGTDKEKLPSSYNGLGYKNLIKMEFLLMSFAKDMEKCSDACIPLLFIEEPESHMHPQMQQTFAKYLEDFLKKIPICIQ